MPENPEVKEGDVAEDPTEPENEKQDSSATAPVDAGEGDPDPENSTPAG